MSFTEEIKNIPAGLSKNFIVEGPKLNSKRAAISQLNSYHNMNLTTTYDKETKTLTVTNNG